MYNAIIYIEKTVCCQKFWCILSGVDILLEQAENEILHTNNWFKFVRYENSFTNFAPFSPVNLYKPLA